MNKIIFFSIFLVIASTTFCQPIESSPTLTKQEYLHKSKNQKTAAWFLLGGGFVLFTTGVAIATKEAASELSGVLVSVFIGAPSQVKKKSNTSGILFYTGLASMVGSIPLFVSSSKNKKNATAISASIKFEESFQAQQSAFNKIQFPAIAIKIKL